MNSTRRKPEETFKINGNWAVQAMQLQALYPQLTNDDVRRETGNENALLTRIQNRLHKNREEVIAIIRNGEKVDI